MCKGIKRFTQKKFIKTIFITKVLQEEKKVRTFAKAR